MTEQSLAHLKVRELADICRAKRIPCYRGKNLLRKDELIAAILQAERAENGSTKSSAVDGIGIGNRRREAMVKGNGVATAEDVPAVDMDRRMQYIESAQVGTLMAFRLPNGKVKSAKVVKKSTKSRRFMLETEYGAQYIVDYGDIVWVRTTKRWPRGVYKLLKGMSENGQASQ